MDLTVGVTNESDKVSRTIIAFKLAGIPAGAVVTGCKLTVNVTQRTSPTAGRVRRLCGEHWLDGDGQSESPATWNNWKSGFGLGRGGRGLDGLLRFGRRLHDHGPGGLHAAQRHGPLHLPGPLGSLPGCDQPAERLAAPARQPGRGGHAEQPHPVRQQRCLDRDQPAEARRHLVAGAVGDELDGIPFVSSS